MRIAAGPAGAIVLAAGQSLRLAGEQPKPFRRLGGRTLLDYSLAAFAAAPSVACIVVVVPAELVDSVREAYGSAPKVVAVTAGGTARQRSVACGLARLPAEIPVVAVHDAARPLVSADVIEAVIAGVGPAETGPGTERRPPKGPDTDGGSPTGRTDEGELPTGQAAHFDGAIAAVPLDDAIKEVGDGCEILGPRSRAGLWRAQTPQAFSRECLQASLEGALADGVTCDDCSEMATRAGYRVRVVLGDPCNIKVTRPADLELCERLVAMPSEPLTGSDGSGTGS